MAYFPGFNEREYCPLKLVEVAPPLSTEMATDGKGSLNSSTTVPETDWA